MAAITINVHPGPNGPLYLVTSTTTGHTVTINDYLHNQNIDKNAAPIKDGQGRIGQQATFTL